MWLFSSQQKYKKYIKICDIRVSTGRIGDWKDRRLWCYNCFNESANGSHFSRCSKCKGAWYCNAQCQKANWKYHKKTCGIPDFDSLREMETSSLISFLQNSFGKCAPHKNTVCGSVACLWRVYAYVGCFAFISHHKEVPRQGKSHVLLCFSRCAADMLPKWGLISPKCSFHEGKVIVSCIFRDICS